MLLPVPDPMNNLIGVLMRFRKEKVEVMCDVEQMFYSFHVDPAHRDFLPFLWFEGNDPLKPITQYRMNVHLFGNGLSPAVAMYGLRRTGVDGEEEYGEEAKNFIYRNFYVDVDLALLPTAQRAATAKLQLYKVVSNSVKVMEAFPVKDRAKDCVTSTCAMIACQRNGCSEFSGTWSQTPSPSRRLCQRNHSPGEESCLSSTLCMTCLVSWYLSCLKGVRMLL